MTAVDLVLIIVVAALAVGVAILCCNHLIIELRIQINRALVLTSRDLTMLDRRLATIEQRMTGARQRVPPFVPPPAGTPDPSTGGVVIPLRNPATPPRDQP